MSAFPLKIVFLLGVSSIFLTSALADDVRYISDKLYISLRAEKGDEAAVVSSGLTSGTPLKLIQEDSSGYSRVELRNGTQGWIRSRYLSKEPTAALKLAELEKRFSESTSKNDADLLKELDTLKDQNRKLNEQNTAAQRQLDDIKQASGNVIKIMEQNRTLNEKNQILQSEVDQLEAVKEKFKSDSSMDWFIYGGFLVIFTLVVKAIIEHFQRRSSYSSWG